MNNNTKNRKLRKGSTVKNIYSNEKYTVLKDVDKMVYVKDKTAATIVMTRSDLEKI